MIQQRRRLPHIYPDSTSLFVTWSLHGVLPPSFSARPGKLSDGQAFVWMDRQLDTARSGRMWLRQPALARLIVESIHKGVQLGHYELFAGVVMANHVHILIRPHIDPSRLLKPLKGSTAREANKLLRRTGEPFWQKESYDHWVRNQAEFDRIRAYIENNPVKAGLVQLPEEYPWSSASVETSLDAARTSACATNERLKQKGDATSALHHIREPPLRHQFLGML
ncbi:MAG: transposase [Bryobacteraceae bacterium]